MITKKELMIRICDIEAMILVLEEKIAKLEKPAKKTVKKGKK